MSPTISLRAVATPYTYLLNGQAPEWQLEPAYFNRRKDRCGSFMRSHNYFDVAASQAWRTWLRPMDLHVKTGQRRRVPIIPVGPETYGTGIIEPGQPNRAVDTVLPQSMDRTGLMRRGTLAVQEVLSAPYQA